MCVHVHVGMCLYGSTKPEDKDNIAVLIDFLFSLQGMGCPDRPGDK